MLPVLTAIVLNYILNTYLGGLELWFFFLSVAVLNALKQEIENLISASEMELEQQDSLVNVLFLYSLFLFASCALKYSILG